MSEEIGLWVLRMGLFRPVYLAASPLHGLQEESTAAGGVAVIGAVYDAPVYDVISLPESVNPPTETFSLARLQRLAVDPERTPFHDLRDVFDYPALDVPLIAPGMQEFRLRAQLVLPRLAALGPRMVSAGRGRPCEVDHIHVTYLCRNRRQQIHVQRVHVRVIRPHGVDGALAVIDGEFLILVANFHNGVAYPG